MTQETGGPSQGESEQTINQRLSAELITEGAREKLGLPETATDAEVYAAQGDQNNKEFAVANGLPEDATKEEIAAKYHEMGQGMSDSMDV